MQPGPTRRKLVLTALATAAGIPGMPDRPLPTRDRPGSNERPQQADILVVSEGEHAGQVIKPQDLKLGGPPVRAWPKDPNTSVVRNGSRLNEVLVIRLDPAELDDETRSRAADGIVAYSAICTHAGCPDHCLDERGNGRQGHASNAFAIIRSLILGNSAQVVFGPARRRLAALPLAADGWFAHGSRNICWKGRCSRQGEMAVATASIPRQENRVVRKTNGR